MDSATAARADASLLIVGAQVICYADLKFKLADGTLATFRYREDRVTSTVRTLRKLSRLGHVHRSTPIKLRRVLRDLRFIHEWIAELASKCNRMTFWPVCAVLAASH